MAMAMAMAGYAPETQGGARDLATATCPIG